MVEGKADVKLRIHVLGDVEGQAQKTPKFFWRVVTRHLHHRQLQYKIMD